jgi:ubiquinone/menaquinone biosynthesis C-methylase UbiE
MDEYDKWEKVYARYRAEPLPWELGRPRPVLVDLIKSKKVTPKGKALDICCGLGTNTIYLAQVGFETTGFDISKTAVAQARRKARRTGVEIQFYVGSALDLPFGDDEFDFVFDMGCFHHIFHPDRGRFVRGIRRVLKKEAHYFMVCFSDKNGSAWNHFSKQEITTIWSPYFDVISIDHFSSVEGDGRIRFFFASLMQCSGDS